MLPRKLPPAAPIVCDRCLSAELTVTSATFEEAWDEIHAADWMLFGGRGGRWQALCPECRPHGDRNARGPGVGTVG